MGRGNPAASRAVGIGVGAHRARRVVRGNGGGRAGGTGIIGNCGRVFARLLQGGVGHGTGHRIGGRRHLGLSFLLVPAHPCGRRRAQQQGRGNGRSYQHARHDEHHRVAEVVRQEDAREGPDGAAQRDGQHEVPDALALAIRRHHARDDRGYGGGTHAVGEPVHEAHADERPHRLVQQIEGRQPHLGDAADQKQRHTPEPLHEGCGGEAREQGAHDERARAEGGHGGRSLVHRKRIGGHDHHEHEVVAGDEEVQQRAGHEVARPEGLGRGLGTGRRRS